MRILFVVRSLQIFHYYESIEASLKFRGHHVSILFDKKWSSEESRTAEDVKEPYEWAVEPAHNLRRRFLLFFREVRSWRRYLLIQNQSSFYAERWLKYVSPKFRAFIKVFPFLKFLIKTSATGKFLERFEKKTLADAGIIADIKKYNPDVVIAGPICFRQSSADLEYQKAAHALGIPTAVPVMTWDTLTTKGIFHIIPDQLLVWNETQIKEAEEHHGISKEKIKIIGAPFFDKWFTPTLERGIFKTAQSAISRLVWGFTPPYILYLGSSDNIAPDERWLIKEIKEAVDLPVIFRPHPANFKIYQDFNMSDVTISPKNGEMPKTHKALQDLYNMFQNASLIVGVNTSAMIDALVAGFPVVALERSEFKKTQSLAQHYQYLREADAVEVSKNTEDFKEIFTRLSSGVDSKKFQREQFIKNFIRPTGLKKSAGESAADEIEKLAKPH